MIRDGERLGGVKDCIGALFYPPRLGQELPVFAGDQRLPAPHGIEYTHAQAAIGIIPLLGDDLLTIEPDGGLAPGQPLPGTIEGDQRIAQVPGTRRRLEQGAGELATKTERPQSLIGQNSEVAVTKTARANLEYSVGVLHLGPLAQELHGVAFIPDQYMLEAVRCDENGLAAGEIRQAQMVVRCRRGIAQDRRTQNQRTQVTPPKDVDFQRAGVALNERGSSPAPSVARPGRRLPTPE